MDLKAYLEKFESEAKADIGSFIDFVHAEEKKLHAPFEPAVAPAPAPSTDDGNPPVVASVVAPVVAQEPVVQEPVAEEVTAEDTNTVETEQAPEEAEQAPEEAPDQTPAQ